MHRRYTRHIRDMTFGEYMAASPADKAAYDKWWWDAATKPNIKQWLDDERVDMEIHKANDEWPLGW